MAQGTLQAIFEFQTIVSELFGLPIANASMYDGASAAAEAVLMAKRLTRRERVLVSADVHPHYRETIDTYLQGVGSGKKAIQTVPLGDDERPLPKSSVRIRKSREESNTRSAVLPMSQL